MKFVFLCLIFSIIPIWSECTKILAIMPVVSRSHHVWNTALTYELAKRGFEITYLSPDKDKNPPSNIRQFHMEGAHEGVDTGFDIIGMVSKLKPNEILNDMIDYGLLTCQLEFQSQGLKKFIEVTKNETFDLIILDFGINECMFGLLDLFPNIPVVGVTAFADAPTTNWILGNPEALSVKPSIFLLHPGKMNFFERVQNYLTYTIVLSVYYYYYMPRQREIALTVLPKMSPYEDLFRRFDLLLLNEHFSLNPSAPVVPALVHVGGLQLRPSQALPSDIQKFLDDSKDGAIFFSLGTNVKSSQLEPQKIKSLVEAFRELAPLRILWKWETDTLPGKPDNVKIAKWLPQRDILAHPNIKLFFTHSGLLSTQETLYHGVPIIGMPFLVDQHINLDKCISMGYAEKLDYVTLTKDIVFKKIRTVIDNPKYKENAARLSKIFKDQKETPLERAVFWIEYVIRHRGAKHLRSEVQDQTWYEYYLCDVILFLATCSVVALYMLWSIVSVLYRFVTGTNKNKIKTQ